MASPHIKSIRSIKHIKKELVKRMQAHDARVNPPVIPPPIDESKLILGKIPQEFPILDLTARSKDGSRFSRGCRKNGQLPVMLYGQRKATGERVEQLATVEKREVDRLLRLFGESIENSLVRVNLRESDKDDVVDWGLCTPRDLQVDPVNESPLNVNLLLFEPGRVLDIPISFFNAEECPGLKRGGYINFIRRSLKVKALSERVPQTLVVNLTNKHVGDRIKLEDIDFPSSIEMAKPLDNDILLTIGGKRGGAKAAGDEDDESASA